VKDPVTVPERTLLRVIKLLESAREEHLNGGDRDNMTEARHLSQAIVDLKFYIKRSITR
jgi:hypothetical protein